jgi:hypothetical protein
MMRYSSCRPMESAMKISRVGQLLGALESAKAVPFADELRHRGRGLEVRLFAQQDAVPCRVESRAVHHVDIL